MAWYKQTIIKTVEQDVFVEAESFSAARKLIRDYDWTDEGAEATRSSRLEGRPEEVSETYAVEHMERES